MLSTMNTAYETRTYIVSLVLVLLQCSFNIFILCFILKAWYCSIYHIIWRIIKMFSFKKISLEAVVGWIVSPQKDVQS